MLIPLVMVVTVGEMTETTRQTDVILGRVEDTSRRSEAHSGFSGSGTVL